MISPRLRLVAAALVCGFGLAPRAQAASVTVPSQYATIGAAVQAVRSGQLASGSVIQVQPGTYREALVLAGTPVSLTIRAAGPAGSVVIDASGTGLPALRVVQASGAVRFEGLVFTGGTGGPGNGGGFTVEDASPQFLDCWFRVNTAPNGGAGVLTRSAAGFVGCVFESNTATAMGGGLVITTGSRNLFVRCQFRNNVAGVTSPTGSGGAVHVNDASPTFQSCSITNNRARFAGGGIIQIGQYGSAYGTSTLVLEDSEVSGNTASRWAQTVAYNPAEGGGIHVEDNARAIVRRSQVTANVADTGGGINVYRATVDIVHSIISSNAALDALGVGGFGGGIAATSNNVTLPLRPASVVTLDDSAVVQNQALRGGAVLVGGDQLCAGGGCDAASATIASLSLSGSLLASNTARQQGGAVVTDRTQVQVTSSQILRNTVWAYGGQSYAGGILLSGRSVGMFSDATIAGNAATDYGGGVFLDNGASLTLSASLVYGNSAAHGGGLFVGSTDFPTGTVQGTTIADNAGDWQILEQACGGLPVPILAYRDNVIASAGNVYKSVCGAGITTVTAFNALSSGRASGNTSTAPRLSRLSAVPALGPGYAGWVVTRLVGQVTISGVGTSALAVGVQAVAPARRTVFTLSAQTSSGAAPTASATMAAAWNWGGAGDLPVPADYDGDGTTDSAVYRPSAGVWFILLSSGGMRTVSWGAPGGDDQPVPGDYDGDGAADVAVFRASTGAWYILRSSTQDLSIINWGATGDSPVPGDYDGDGRTDAAVFRAATGAWYVRRSSGGMTAQSWGWGGAGDVPVPADYDGDDRTDVAVYRTTTGQWFVLGSAVGFRSAIWGSPSLGDVPVPADFDGDHKADIAVCRPGSGEWFISGTVNGLRRESWGCDIPVTADVDGDGMAEPTVWTSGTWRPMP